jgi:hypothetical protein
MTFVYAFVPAVITLIMCLRLWRLREFGFHRDDVFVAAGWGMFTVIIVITAFIKELL